MTFSSKEDLIAYYKQYNKQYGFEIMTQRSIKRHDGSVRYVTLGCSRDGKARNRTLNVTKLCSTIKMECKTMINALSIDGILYVVDNG